MPTLTIIMYVIEAARTFWYNDKDKGVTDGPGQELNGHVHTQTQTSPCRTKLYCDNHEHSKWAECRKMG